MGKQYIAKIDNLYLQGKDTTSDIEEADIFESETEPRQRINQMKKDGKLNKKAKVTINALESQDKLFESIFKENINEMSLDEYCDSINSDSHYVQDFKNWVKEGIHGKDILPRSRWSEIWDDFAGTWDDDDEEEEVTQFEVDVDAEKPLKVWKDGSRWKCSDGSTYMSYLKPADVVYWLRKDYGRAWLVESTNRKMKESNLRDSYNSILKDIKDYILMCNDSEDRFSGKKSFELSKRIFIGNLSKTYMIHTNHIEEWFREVEVELEKEGNSFWWKAKLEESKLKESKIKVLYDNLTEEIRNFILHDDEMDNFSGFDSYEFAREEFFEKLSDKYMVTVDCIEEIFSEIEYELAHEDEDIQFQESKKRSSKRIKEDSWEDPYNTTWYRDAQKKQSNEPKYTPEQFTVAENFWQDTFYLVKESLGNALRELGFTYTNEYSPYKAYEYTTFASSGPKRGKKFLALPGSSIGVRVNIGNYGIKNKDGEEFDCSDLAKKLADMVNDDLEYSDVNIIVHRAEPRNQLHEYYELEFKTKVPEDLFTDSYYMDNYIY